MGSSISLPSGNVDVYNKCGYTGSTIRLPVSNYTTYKLNTFGLNTTGIQSLTIGPNTVVELYTGDNFSGKMIRAINDQAHGTKGVSCLQHTNLGSADNVGNLVTVGSLKIMDFQTWKKNYKPPQVVSSEGTSTLKGSNVMIDSNSGNQLLDIKHGADGSMNLEGVNNKKIVIKDLKTPLKISNVNGLCVIKEMVNNNKENLTIRDIHTIAEKCVNSVEVNPVTCPLTCPNSNTVKELPNPRDNPRDNPKHLSQKENKTQHEEEHPHEEEHVVEKFSGSSEGETITTVYKDNLMWVLCVTLLVLIIIWIYMMNYNK